jgi:hypothetical protein
MNEKRLFRIRLYITGLITLAMWSLLVWQHFHGGVPSHYILNRADLPSISNWWGGFLLPLLTWFLLLRIHKRILKNSDEESESAKYLINILIGFVGALLFGVMISVAFVNGYEDATSYMVLALFPLALLLPIFRAEYLLGFALGMTYTFGAVLPTGFGLLLMIIFAGLYYFIRPLILRIYSFKWSR